jgi:hypothetical protein
MSDYISHAVFFVVGLLCGQWIAGVLYGKQIEALTQLLKTVLCVDKEP